MKKFIFVAFMACMTVFGYVAAEQGDFSTLGFNTPGGYSFWRVDSNGHFKPGFAATYDIGTSLLPVRTVYAGGITTTGTTSAANIVATGDVSVGGAFQMGSKTKAQLLLITPSTTGIMYFCSDCSGASRVALSTGTSLHSWGTIASSSTYPN